MLRALIHHHPHPLSRLRPFTFTRGYRLHHMTEGQQRRALEAEIPFVDYKILHREMNHLTKGAMSDHVANLVSLNEYRRNVKDLYAERLRRVKWKKRAKVQSLFCLLLHSLHYSCLDEGSMIGSVKYFAQEVEKEVRSTIGSSWGEVKKVHDMEMATQFKSLYWFGDTRIPTTTAPATAAMSLAGLLHESPHHTSDDVLAWISSTTASTVMDACTALEGRAEIPVFIIKDILERIPRSDYEVELQNDLYARMECDETSMGILKSLIKSTKLYRCSDLVKLVTSIVEKEKYLKEADLNMLMFEIGDNVQKVGSKEYSFGLIRAQKVCVDHLASKGNEITGLGFLGMAMSLSGVSSTRARLIHRRAVDLVNTEEEKKLERRVRLHLSHSPYELDESFGDRTDEELWSDFFELSQDYHKLHELSSEAFVQNPRSPKHPQHTLMKTLSAPAIINSRLELNNRSTAALISKLYRHSGPIGHFATGADAARSIFHSLASPTRAITGELLLGESFLQPECAYELFTKYIHRFCDGVANEKCLLSLIFPAMNHDGLTWENRRAPQLAVYEFRKAVKMSPDDSRPLIASTRLWRSYIQLCGRCSYHYELTEVFEAWEKLRFVPDRKTLGMLLGAVPDGVGERIRRHGVENLCPSEYDEIVTDVWEWPGKKDVERWRDEMVSHPLRG